MTAAKVVTKTVVVMETWGSRCERIVIFSDSVHAYQGFAESWTNAEIVVLDHVSHAYMDLVAKHKAVLRHLAASYLPVTKYNWFYKAEDDSFVVVENLHQFLTMEQDMQASTQRTPLLVGTRYQ
eukprot:3937376-Rhodomonas_salina.1